MGRRRFFCRSVQECARLRAASRVLGATVGISRLFQFQTELPVFIFKVGLRFRTRSLIEIQRPGGQEHEEVSKQESGRPTHKDVREDAGAQRERSGPPLGDGRQIMLSQSSLHGPSKAGLCEAVESFLHRSQQDDCH